MRLTVKNETLGNGETKEFHVPEFKSYEEEAAFWDNIDTADYMEDDGEWFRFETPRKRATRKSTKMTDKIGLNDELRPEYDGTLLKNGIRGKYAERYAAGTNIVRLEPDVAAVFPNEEAVNEALRFVLKLMEDTRHLGSHRDW